MVALVIFQEPRQLESWLSREFGAHGLQQQRPDANFYHARAFSIISMHPVFFKVVLPSAFFLFFYFKRLILGNTNHYYQWETCVDNPKQKAVTTINTAQTIVIIPSRNLHPSQDAEPVACPLLVTKGESRRKP